MKTTNSSFEETFALDSAMLNDEETKLHIGSDGYLRCQPRIARTGIQLYSGREVGRPDLQVVRVYRPETEVMSRDSLRSLAGKPVTIEHPDTPITAENWKDKAVGHLGDEILRDGEFIRVPLHLMDASAIKEVRGGRSQLSVGYTAQLQWGDGVTPDGQSFDVTQTAIRANHVAITHTARGGPLLRMGDGKSKEKKMATRTIVIDTVPVELDERDAPVIERRIAALETEIANGKTALANALTTQQNDVATVRTELANSTALTQTKDAEIATLKSQLANAKVTPEQLDQMADARAAVKQRAKALLDSVVLDKKTDAEIRRQVVHAKLGDVAKDWNDDMVNASFNTLTVTSDNNGFVNNGLQHVTELVRYGETGIDQVAKAYTQYNNDISNRWKNAGGRVAQ